MQGERFEFIEGTRGVAAMMVVIAHYCSAFFPTFARVSGGPPHFQWETSLANTPVFTMAAGSMAVFIFFIMSGFVLTGAFMTSSLSISRLLFKRFVRLFLPVACAVIFAFAMLYAFMSAKSEASTLTGSHWLAELSSNPMTLASMMRDLLVDSMLGGYDQSSIFDGALHLLGRSPLSPINDAADAPLWSLHAEFWGSVSVLLLVAAHRRLNRFVFWTGFAATLIASGSSWFSLFMLGFVAYVFREPILRHGGFIKESIGIALFSAGIFLSYTTYGATVDAIQSFVRETSKLHITMDWRIQGELSAMLMLAGIAMTQIGRAFMKLPILLKLGRVSFSLYLIHFPILFTVGCSVFLIAAAHLSYGLAVIATAASVGLLTILLAALFERSIDRPATRIAAHISRLNLPLANREQLSQEVAR